MTDVAVMEDSISFNELFDIYIQNPHKIIARAATREDGLALAEDIVSGKIKADIVLLDGHLRNGSPEDGQDIADILSTMDNPPIVVGISGSSNNYAKEEYRMPKQKFLGSALVRLLDEVDLARFQDGIVGSNTSDEA